MRTRLTDLLGIARPIVSAPLARMSGGSLAAAVSAAGGLGTFGAVARSMRITTSYISRQLELLSETEQPFGVGFLTHNIQHSPENFEHVLDADVPVLLFSFADPTEWVSRANAAGRTTICQVQTLDDARIAVDAGADVIAVQGNAAGGHTGRQNLLPFLVETLNAFPNVPVVAAGGITEARSLAAVLAAGADGAWIGSAFLATHEATELSDEYKAAVVDCEYGETLHTKVFDIANEATLDDVAWPAHIGMRVRPNQFTERWHGADEELAARVDEIGPTYAKSVMDGDLRVAPVLVGEGAGSIRAIRPVAEVIDELCAGAQRLLSERTRALLG